MRLKMEPITREYLFWDKVEALAKEAFPPEKYLEPEIMVQMAQKETFDFWALTDGEAFVGFLTTYLYGDLVYLFFLAIDGACRSKGYGRRALELLKERYPGKRQVVDFEKLDETAENRDQRRKRKEFYLRNGYRETGLFVSYCGVDYEVMCGREDFRAEEFKEMMYSIPFPFPDFSPVFWEE